MGCGNVTPAEPEWTVMVQQKIRRDRNRPADRARSYYFGFALVGAASAGFASAGFASADFASAGLAAAAFAAAACIMLHQAVGSEKGFLVASAAASSGAGCIAFIDRKSGRVGKEC